MSNCSTWWKNALFIDNLLGGITSGNNCIPWGWYLSNDMQLFIVSLIPLYIYACHS